jgi:hypothetical protein
MLSALESFLPALEVKAAASTVSATCCVVPMPRLAKQEVELGSLQLEVKQGQQDMARKVSRQHIDRHTTNAVVFSVSVASQE